MSCGARLYWGKKSGHFSYDIGWDSENIEQNIQYYNYIGKAGFKKEICRN